MKQSKTKSAPATQHPAGAAPSPSMSPAPEPAATPPSEPPPCPTATVSVGDTPEDPRNLVVWHEVNEYMFAARLGAGMAQSNERDAVAAVAAGEPAEQVAAHVRRARSYRQDALTALDKALATWQKWYPRDPFPDGEPDALRRKYGGSLAPRQPWFEARFLPAWKDATWQTLGMYESEAAARAALTAACGPSGGSVRQWIHVV